MPLLILSLIPFICALAIFICVMYINLTNPKYRKDTVETLKQIFISAAGGIIVASPFISAGQTIFFISIYFVFLAFLILIIPRYYR